MEKSDDQFNLNALIESAAAESLIEKDFLKRQGKWFRLLADLIDKHQRIDDIAAVLVELIGAEEQLHLNNCFELDQRFAELMKLRTHMVTLDKLIIQRSAAVAKQQRNNKKR
jgi:hypothetical protein